MIAFCKHCHVHVHIRDLKETFVQYLADQSINGQLYIHVCIEFYNCIQLKMVASV